MAAERRIRFASIIPPEPRIQQERTTTYSQPFHVTVRAIYQPPILLEQSPKGKQKRFPERGRTSRLDSLPILPPDKARSATMSLDQLANSTGKSKSYLTFLMESGIFQAYRVPQVRRYFITEEEQQKLLQYLHTRESDHSHRS